MALTTNWARGVEIATFCLTSRPHLVRDRCLIHKGKTAMASLTASHVRRYPGLQVWMSMPRASLACSKVYQLTAAAGASLSMLGIMPLNIPLSPSTLHVLANASIMPSYFSP